MLLITKALRRQLFEQCMRTHARTLYIDIMHMGFLLLATLLEFKSQA